MIEIEYKWNEVFENLRTFKLGQEVRINNENCRLVGMKLQVRNSANTVFKLTYATCDEIKNAFGTDMYDEEFIWG